jgi:hypothetical protein
LPTPENEKYAKIPSLGVKYTQLRSSQKMEIFFLSFIAGVVDTSDKHSFAIISANFHKKSKRSQWHTQGPGGH